jgi:hypothetical protein
MRRGGTLIVLLHKVEAWDTMNLIASFDGFSNVRLFKPETSHNARSSFYMIAQEVMPQYEEAHKAKE